MGAAMQEAKDKPREKSGKSDERRARLGQALRANLLKRKAQAKAKEPSPRNSDEGRQS
jgi:hypothetical protein